MAARSFHPVRVPEIQGTMTTKTHTIAKGNMIRIALFVVFIDVQRRYSIAMILDFKIIAELNSLPEI